MRIQGYKMRNLLNCISLMLVALALVVTAAPDAHAKKKKIPKKPKYVGSVKCNGSCHDPYYQAWKNTPHGKSFISLKAGEKAEAKKAAGLDPEKDYTTDPTCLRCHTTGYKQSGGFKPAGSKSKKGKDTSTAIDPTEPNKEQVGCEMCHAAAGGSQFRVVMKNTKGDFKKADAEKYGLRWDYANVCTRCHMHPQSPHKDEKFDFEGTKGTVHQIDKYFTEDNADQKLEKVKDRAQETAVSQEKPLLIEDWEVSDKGKLKFKKGTKPWSTKKKSALYKE